MLCLEMFATLLTCCWIWSLYTVESAVLDPALYLAPSPPLTATSDAFSPAQLWSQHLDTRTVRDTRDVSVETFENKKDVTDPPIEKAKMFWPKYNTPQYSLAGIQIPLTFSLSGTYGRIAGVPSGVISGAYASISDTSTTLFGKYGKSALAGSSYGNYGSGQPSMQIYASDSSPTWSGWGNGKWGHYGKG